jgi:hypothetical protein
LPAFNEMHKAIAEPLVDMAAQEISPQRGRVSLPVEQRHGVVPQTHVDSHVFADRTNGTRAAGPSRRRESLQAAGDEIFLHLCG